MSVQYLVGDVFDRMAELPDSSVDLILTSPPFLALRSYLPADHPDKGKEIGSEKTPAEFIDVLLRLTAEWRRLLTPHGTICVELGDTYSGSGGAGGDYSEDGLREGQPKFRQAVDRPQDDDGGYQADQRVQYDGQRAGIRNMNNKIQGGGPGWPLAKSLTLTPEAYRFALAYGTNPHTGQPSPAGTWRIRNVIRWVRPNPPVGALGDKFRPATSELVVACVSKDRWFDLDAVRDETQRTQTPATSEPKSTQFRDNGASGFGADRTYHADGGAPPLDWWKISPKGYAGAHYAVWPSELCVKPIKAMCPKEVCRECGEPRRRIVSNTQNFDGLAEHIQQQREKAGMSRADFIPLLPHYKNGDSITAQLSNWELGKNIPSPHDWAILKETINVSSSYDSLICDPRSLVEYEFLHSNGPKNVGRTTETAMGNLTTRANRVGTNESWSDCGHDNYRPGLVLDPFAGTGVSGMVADGHGRDAILIDIDERNYELARDRIGPLLFDSSNPTSPDDVRSGALLGSELQGSRVDRQRNRD